MDRYLPSATLAAAGLFFLLTTAMSGLNPAAFAERLGLAVANPGGANEIRAQYAGFFLALALLCALGLSGAVSRQAALIALVVTFGGLLAGRLASLGLNGGVAGFPPTVVALYLIDFLGLALSLGSLRVMR